MAKDHLPSLERRDVLKQIMTAGAVAPGLLAGGVASVVASRPAEAQTQAAPAPSAAKAAPPAAPPPGYQSLSPDEAAFTETMVNIMCPADHLTPNGVDCGLATFIDRQLSGGFGQGENTYVLGPWRKGKPQFGPQFPMTPEQFFKAGIAAANVACVAKFGVTFDAIPTADAESFLDDLSKGKVTDPRVTLAAWFNTLAYPLFVEACFADPIYGGNKDKVFWKLVGYPGLPATHTRDMVDYRGKPFPGANDPKSIADFS